MPISMTSVYDAMRLRFSGPITVTLTRPASPAGGAAASTTAAYVQEQAASERSVADPMGTGMLGGTRRAFRMWLVECLNMPPHQGYLITKADGSVWHVDEVEPLCKGRCFRCHCTKRPGT